MPAASFEAFPDPADPVKVLAAHGHPAHTLGLRFGRSYAESSCLYLSSAQARALHAQLAVLYAPPEPEPPADGRPLDHAWRAVDALGGWFNRANPEAVGYDRALGDAQRAIEALGGMDPAKRPPA